MDLVPIYPVPKVSEEVGIQTIHSHHERFSPEHLPPPLPPTPSIASNWLLFESYQMSTNICRTVC